jgi:hypothetical protein
MNAMGWLEYIWTKLIFEFNSVAVSSIVLVGVVVLFMFYITKDNKKPEEKKD